MKLSWKLQPLLAELGVEKMRYHFQNAQRFPIVSFVLSKSRDRHFGMVGASISHVRFASCIWQVSLGTFVMGPVDRLTRCADAHGW